MEETAVNLQEFSSVNNEDGSRTMEKPILKAARKGDAEELKRLLREKTEYASKQPNKKYVYPEDWKYHFQDLLEKDSAGRTALHLAANVGNHKMSYNCVIALLESIQMLRTDPVEGTPLEKHKKLVNMKDKNNEAALHVAIENKAPEVVAYLLDNQANMLAKNRKGVEALRSIYETLPDAIKEVYDESVQLSDDYKKLSINWGPVIGFRKKTKKKKPVPVNNEDYKQVPRGEMPVESDSLWNESEYLKYILISDKWGAPILLHPLLQLYLELKWKKVHWFFWVPFVLEMLWLFLYAAAFMDLNLEIKSNATGRCAGIKDISTTCTKRYHMLWIAMVPITLICLLKEIYQAFVLRRAYWSFENLTQVTFILLFGLQFGLLLAGYLEIVVPISVVGIILSTVLVIFQLGKTPRFGCQVAALKKVVLSCAPHLPVFFVWFIGFGLIFWAIFYKAEESWLVGMVAIMAAMGTGELNAQDHLEPDVEEGQGISFKEVVRVFALLFFVIIIVTLYFNLLIGYAVSDIQLLKTKAEALQLSNKLNTIYTIESFLTTRPGQAIVSFKCKLQRILGSSPSYEDNCMESIYLLPPKDFEKFDGTQEFEFESIPTKLLIPLKDVAYTNVIKENEKAKKDLQNLLELLEPDSAEIQMIKSGIET